MFQMICYLCGYDGPPDGHTKCKPEPPQGPPKPRMRTRSASEHIAELERVISIKESRESQFDSTLKATMAERDGAIKLREMIEANRDQLRLDKVELERERDEFKVRLQTAYETSDRLRAALERIASDWGTDACDGNTMIAHEALECK